MPTRRIHSQHSLSAGGFVHNDEPAEERPLATGLAAKPTTAAAVYDEISQSLCLTYDGVRDLSSVGHSWTEPEMERLIREVSRSSSSDVIETLLQSCVGSFTQMFHADAVEGTCTTSPSEAVQLVGHQLLRRWREGRENVDRSGVRPNLAVGAPSAKLWQSFAGTFGVELLPIPADTARHCLNPQQVRRHIDENTIGVVGVLGNLPTGNFDPICELHDVIDGINQRRGWNVPIHVDATTGGFVAAFAHPELVWDFRLPGVQSMQVSGSGYGMTAPNLHWVLCREADVAGSVPDASVLCGLVAQFYNFQRFGRSGYVRLLAEIRDVANTIERSLQATGRLEVMNQSPCLPAICFRVADAPCACTLDLAVRLRERGWYLPVETLVDAGGASRRILRLVIPDGFGPDSVRSFIRDLRCALRDQEQMTRDRRSSALQRVHPQTIRRSVANALARSAVFVAGGFWT